MPESNGKKITAAAIEQAAPLLVRIPAACQMLACSRSRLYELMEANEIESVMRANFWLLRQ